MRRILFPVVAGLAACLPPSFSAAQAPVVLSADDLPAESLAQRGRIYRRGSAPVRQYRSYAIVPGGVSESVQSASAPPPIMGAPVPGPAPAAVASPAPRSSPAPSMGSGSSRGGKPSFMRSDSKARGQFGR